MNSTNSLLLLASQRAYLLFFLIFCCIHSYGYTYCQDFGAACDDGSLATTGDIYNESCECIGAGYCGNGIVIDDVVTYTCSEELQTPDCVGWDADILDTGLLAQYTFDDGTPIDMSGNGHDGIAKNNVQYAKDGVPTGSLVLDDQSSYIEVPDHDDLVIQNGESMSIGVRFKSSPGDRGDIISKPWNSSGNYHYRIVQRPDGKVFFSVIGASGANIITPHALARNTRHHAMMVITPTTMAAYIDGMLVEQKSHGISDWTPASPGDQNRSLAIGTLFPYGQGGRNIPNFTLDGQIDDVRFYDRALPADQVGALFHTTQDIFCKNREDDLIARYVFDAYTYDDMSGLSHHGIPRGGVSIMDTIHRGEVAVFDGVDDDILVPTPSESVDDYTFSVWVKPELGNSRQYILDTRGDGSTSDYQLGLFYDVVGTNIEFNVYNMRTYSPVQATEFAVPVDDYAGKRTHFAGSRVGNTMKLYINGEEMPYTLVGGTAMQTDTIVFDRPWRIGAYAISSPGSNYRLNGQIDDLRIYGTAHSSAKIKSIYDTTKRGTEECVDTLSAGLVAQYLFDVDTNDNTIYKNNGTTVGGLTFVSDPERGLVADFDGVDDYIQVPHSSSLDVDTATTMSVRVNMDTISNAFIAAKGIYPAYNYKLESSLGKRQGVFGDASGQNITTDPNLTSTNQRYHVVQSTDGSSHMLYIDGKLVATTPISGEITTNTHPLFVGRYQGGGYYLDGQMDDLRIYDRTLSELEVQELYDYTRSEPQPQLRTRSDGLIAQYDFEGSSSLDISGFDHHGVELNGATYTNDLDRGVVIDLDGIDDYVQIADFEGGYDDEITLSTRVYLRPGSSSPSGIFGQRNTTPQVNNSFLMYLGDANNAIHTVVQYVDGSYGWLRSSTPIPYNTWTHIAYTRDSQDGSQDFYINGKLDTSGIDGAGKLIKDNPGIPMMLGERGVDRTSAYKLDGKLDDVRVYTKALDQYQIELLSTYDGIEQCDDANTKDNDRCSNACIAEYCRDDAPLNDTSKNFVITSLDPTSIAGTSSQPDSEVVICFEDINGNADIYYTTTDAGGGFSYVPSLASYPGPRVNVGIMLHNDDGLDIDHHSLMMQNE